MRWQLRTGAVRHGISAVCNVGAPVWAGADVCRLRPLRRQIRLDQRAVRISREERSEVQYAVGLCAAFLRLEPEPRTYYRLGRRQGRRGEFRRNRLVRTVAPRHEDGDLYRAALAGDGPDRSPTQREAGGGRVGAMVSPGQ